MYLKISNKGKIDTNAFHKIGLTSKRNDASTIGEFGSGLNYSIVWLVKNDYEFNVFSGDRELKFSTNEIMFRDKNHKVLVIDGIETSFMLGMGHDLWEPWMILREIYCNALDEEDAKWEIVADVEKEMNRTNIYIKITDEIQEVIDKKNEYFSFDRDDVIFEDENENKIFRSDGKQLIVYRKGIRIYSYRTPSLFHYDFNKIKINESRIVADTFAMDQKIVRLLSRTVPADIVYEVCEKIIGTYEQNLYWDWYDVQYGDAWKKVLKDKTVVEKEYTQVFEKSIRKSEKLDKEVLTLPINIVKSVVNKKIANHVTSSDSYNFKEGEILRFTTEERIKINKLIDFLKRRHYTIPYNKINKFRSKNDAIIGSNKEKIFLSESFLKLELKVDQISLLIKENEKIKFDNIKNYAYDFETYLANRIFSILIKNK